MRIRLAIAVVVPMVLVLMAAPCTQAQETKLQNPDESAQLNTQAYIQLLRSDLKSKKEQIVKETMQLDAKQAAAFWPIYNEYDAAQSKLTDARLAIIEDYAQNFLTMTDAKANDLAQKVMTLDDQRLALRKQYYETMKKALPAILVVRFFQVENQLQLLADLQIASHLPIIEERDK